MHHSVRVPTAGSIPQPEKLVRNGVMKVNDHEVYPVEDEAASVGESGEVEHGAMLDVPPPPEPSSEWERPKVMRAPSAPSRQERAEHDSTHCPFHSLV